MTKFASRELFRSLLLDWNRTLPQNVVSASSMYVFRKRSKTHLFSNSFPESPVVSVQWLSHFVISDAIIDLFYLFTYILTEKSGQKRSRRYVLRRIQKQSQVTTELSVN